MEAFLRGWIVGLLALLGGTQSAQAQEPSVFRLDAVFVAVYRSPDPELADRARRVERGLAEELGERHLVVELDRVPEFEDYSAETYLLACPEDRWAGCDYVIADRGRADWAVSGTVVRETPGGVLVRTTIIDVKGSRTVVQFATSVDDEDPTAYVDAVAAFIDRLSETGGLPAEDVRDDPDGTLTAERTAMEQAEREAIAAGLEALEAELGELEIREQEMDIEPARITDADLEKYRQREGATPWASLGMTAGQYKRMRNRGMNVSDFRERLRGRAGQVIVRGGLVAGGGPNQVGVDLRWVVDASTGDVVRRESFQEVRGAFAGGAFGEAGIGLLPWLDVAVLLHSEIGSIDWVIHQENLQDPRVPDEARTDPAGTLLVGGRGTIAFLPDASVRPTLSGGAALWVGPGLGGTVDPASVPVAEFPDPARVLLGLVGPGIELEASPRVSLFGRLDIAVALAGTSLVVDRVGGATLTYPGAPQGSASTGARFSAGVQATFGPLWGRADDRRPADYSEAP